MLKGENYSDQLYENHVSRMVINNMLDGECGILDGYANKMNCTYVSNRITVASGCAIIKGGISIETTSTTTTVSLRNNMYHILVLEIDLSKSNTRAQFNQGVYKILSNNGSFPTLTQQDISMSINTGIYQLPLCRFKTSSSSISDFEDQRRILSHQGLYAQIQAELDRLAEGHLTATDVSYNGSSIKTYCDQNTNNITNLQNTDTYLNSQISNIYNAIGGLRSIAFNSYGYHINMGEEHTWVRVASGYPTMSGYNFIGFTSPYIQGDHPWHIFAQPFVWDGTTNLNLCNRGDGPADFYIYFQAIFMKA